MEFLELAKKRFSSRSYLDREVEEEKITKVLEAARIAPSACNLQPWKIIVVTDKENIKKTASVYKREWLQKAPVILVICGDHNVSWKRSDGKDHMDIDIAIAVDHMTLQAAELGLGTCWVCNFDTKNCSEILNLPEGIEPVVILPLAYPADNVNTERHNLTRKPLSEIVYREKM